MKKALPTDVYDNEGNLVKIVFADGDGNHIIDAIWDPTDEQTSDNRSAFRKWAYHMLNQKDYEIYK